MLIKLKKLNIAKFGYGLQKFAVVYHSEKAYYRGEVLAEIFKIKIWGVIIFMRNFRNLFINFTNESKMMTTLSTLPNWNVSKKNMGGIEYITFEGYEDTVVFSTLGINDKVINSINVLKQDVEVNKMNGYFPLKDDLAYILYKELDAHYNSLFSGNNNTHMYDDGLKMSISLSENDFSNL